MKFLPIEACPHEVVLFLGGNRSRSFWVLNHALTGKKNVCRLQLVTLEFFPLHLNENQHSVYDSVDIARLWGEIMRFHNIVESPSLDLKLVPEPIPSRLRHTHRHREGFSWQHANKKLLKNAWKKWKCLLLAISFQMCLINKIFYESVIQDLLDPS